MNSAKGLLASSFVNKKHKVWDADNGKKGGLSQ
jgi:hypothetical protein